MKTILIVNNNLPECKHAAEFGLALAKKMQANIVLANHFINIHSNAVHIAAGDNDKNSFDEPYHTSLLEHLTEINNAAGSFSPQIKELDISLMDETGLAEVINKNQVWMMVKGMPEDSTEASNNNLNIHTVLNKVLCPLMLVPAGWPIKAIERLAYIADLRYCRVQIVSFLAQLAKAWDAVLSVAHLSAKGLPDIDQKYAMSFFSEQISNNIQYDKLMFNNIKEKNLNKAVDVLINGMHNDVLVMVNHRFHFEEIVGRYITDTLPDNISTPVLIFPY